MTKRISKQKSPKELQFETSLSKNDSVYRLELELLESSAKAQ
jgi:hypothetical protein